MMQLLREVRQSIRASPGFAFAVLITLGLAGLIGLMTLLMSLLGGFMGMAHFTEPSHRVHDLSYGFLFTTAVVGMLAQLRRPSKNVAGILMALIPWVGLLVAAVLSTDTGVIRSAERMLVAAGTVTAALLHPARRDFFRSFSVSRINWVMLGLVIIAAVPLLAFASTNIGLQGTVTNEHAGMGHYGFMTAFGFTVIGVGLLASLRPDGWRLTAWVIFCQPTSLLLLLSSHRVGSRKARGVPRQVEGSVKWPSRQRRSGEGEGIQADPPVRCGCYPMGGTDSSTSGPPGPGRHRAGLDRRHAGGHQSQ